MKQTIITLLFTLVAMSSWAYDFEVDGNYYTIKSTNDKTVEIVGASLDANSGCTIPGNVENNGISYTVTGIGEGCFSMSSVKSVVIPATIKSINEDAFRLCTSLSTIYDYASTPQSISSSTFFFCRNVTLHVYEGLKLTYAYSKGWSSMTILDDISVVKVTSIGFDKTSVICSPYESNKLSVTVSPEDASMKDFDWTSSDVSTVYITTSGRFVGIKKGSATITATAKDGTGITAECNVTVSGLSSQSGSYNEYLKGESTLYSMIVFLDGSVNKSIGIDIQNNGSDFIKLTKVCVINPNTDDALATITDEGSLGWVADGETKSLQILIHQDINAVFECTYIYKDVEYVFRSDKTYTGIMSVMTDEAANHIQDIYTIDGVKSGELHRGYNIVRMSDGTTRKVLCK